MVNKKKRRKTNKNIHKEDCREQRQSFFQEKKKRLTQLKQWHVTVEIIKTMTNTEKRKNRTNLAADIGNGLLYQGVAAAYTLGKVTENIGLAAFRGEEKARRKLIHSTRKARKFLHDREKFEAAVDKLYALVKKVPFLGKYAATLTMWVELVRSYMTGEYRNVPTGTVLTIIGAILYIVNPFDIIPDSIPIIGQLDDMAVLSLANKMVQRDVKNYIKWKQEHNNTAA